MTEITNAAGKKINFDAAAALMDEEITVTLGNGNMDGLTEQEAFDAYCAQHLAKFGEEFEPNKANPVW